MNRFALAGACLVLSAASARAQYVDGLPAAASVSSSDLLPVVQGSTPITGGGFLPGSGTARRATVAQIAGAVGNAYVPYSGASSAVNLGAFPLTLGVASAPSAPGSGGAFYVDSSNVLHFLNGNDDFPLGGACYNSSCGGNGGPHWWISSDHQGYAFGDPHAPSGTEWLLRVQKTVDQAGGGFSHALRVLDTVQGSNTGNLALKNNYTSGVSSIVVADSTLLTNGAAIFGAGLATGTTATNVAHGVPATGQATVTLSAPTAAAMFTAGYISFGTSPSTAAENAVTATCDYWQGNVAPAGNTCVSGFFSTSKWVPGNTIPFGVNIISSDRTGRGSGNSESGSGVVGAECDIDASGPDDGSYSSVQSTAIGIRKCLHIIPASNGPSADGATEIADGIVANLPGGTTTGEPITLDHLVRAINIGGWGNIASVIDSDGSPAGQNSIVLHPGSFTVTAAAAAASGSNQLAISSHQSVGVGQLVSDSAGSIPAGSYVTGIVSAGTGASQTVFTISNNLTGAVTTADNLTFTNKFADGLLFTGTYTDAFANMTNAGGPGIIKLGTALASGTIAQIQMRGNNTLYGLIQTSARDSSNGVLTLTGTGTNGLVNTKSPFQFNSYTFSALPTAAGNTGATVYCSDCLKPGETTGNGTGMLVFADGAAHWISTAGTVAAH